jgi:SEC-C motif domain protein
LASSGDFNHQPSRNLQKNGFVSAGLIAYHARLVHPKVRMGLFRKSVANACPCGSNIEFPSCCGRYLDGGVAAPDAEALMRSRYTAYVMKRKSYLLDTWHPSTRLATLDHEMEQPVKWLELTIKRHTPKDADHAEVEFVARFKVNGRSHRLHEISRFVREGGQWLYVDGDVS